MSNFATQAGTSGFFAKYPAMQTSTLGRTGLTVSAAGFGSYRIDVQNSTHRAALTMALTSGVNLIDTSSNYADGGSEKLVGEVMAELIAQGQLAREQIVIVTKGGYLQGENYALSQRRKGAGNPFPDLVEYSSGLEHSIHPEFLEDQIGRSLSRLGLEKIDVYLLHNPEYYLGWAKKGDLPLADARQEYQRRLSLAFSHLEKEVERGRIRWYGVSSNGFPSSADSYDFTAVEQLLELANEHGSDHHFAVIQLPLNPLETGGLTEPNQSKGRSTVELSRAAELGVLVNRPLNAVVGNNLIRLADVPTLEAAAEPEIVEGVIESLRLAEQRLIDAVMISDLPFRTKQEFAATMAAGRLLGDRWRGFGTLSNWRDVVSGYLRPRSGFGVQFLRRRPELPSEAAGWIDAYEQAFEETVAAVTAVYQGEERGRIALIKDNISSADPEWAGAPTISRAALRALRSTAGLSTILVGMRRPDYVAEVIDEFSEPVPVRPRSRGWALLNKMVAE